jgi:hypothetical protein
MIYIREIPIALFGPGLKTMHAGEARFDLLSYAVGASGDKILEKKIKLPQPVQKE